MKIFEIILGTPLGTRQADGDGGATADQFSFKKYFRENVSLIKTYNSYLFDDAISAQVTATSAHIAITIFILRLNFSFNLVFDVFTSAASRRMI